MKVGILTYHRAQNCGAMLQAWALANFLIRKLSLDAEVIDYGCVGAEKRFPISFKSIRSFLSSLKGFILSLGIESCRIKKFANFAGRRLPLSPRVGLADLARMSYTHFVVGSDQVWNMKLNKNDYAYFMGFDTTAKRIAYAPSFGANQFTALEKKRIASALAKFDFLSVRESSAQELVRELCGRVAEFVCDPTLLMEADDYLELEHALPGVKGDYVLLYTIGENQRAENMAEELARASLCPVLHLQGAKHARWHVSSGNLRQVDVFGPQEFVWCFRRAKCVVTNSFHGTAFSVINHRHFYSVINGEGGDSRIVDFLSKIGLVGQVVGLQKGDSPFVTSDRIDWGAVDGKLNLYRSRSIAYLRKALERENSIISK